MRAGLFVATALVSAPALAGPWYYDWSCSGACAPGQLGISGREGPYASEDECNAARNNDWRRMAWFEDGQSLGGLGNCEEFQGDVPSADTSNSGGGPPIHTNGFAVSLDVGPGWTAQEPGRDNTAGNSTVGLSFELHGGGSDQFWLVAGGSLQITQVHAAYFRQETQPLIIGLLSFGVGSSPLAIVDSDAVMIRPHLAGALDVAGVTGCSTCDADQSGATFPSLGLLVHANLGVDVYFGADKSNGVGIDVMVPFLGLGDLGDGTTPVRLTPPTLMLRVRYTGRDPS